MFVFEVYLLFRDLDFRIFRGVEFNMCYYRWVFLEDIVCFVRVDVEIVFFCFGKFDDWGLVVRRSDIGYIGY